MQRWALSHRLATSRNDGALSVLTSDLIQRLIPDLRTPNPPAQMVNLIRLIGDHESETGTPFPIIDPAIVSRVGCTGPLAWRQIKGEMSDRGLWRLWSNVRATRGGTQILIDGASLTLKVWEIYEKEKRGHIVGSYGFMAMKFNDPELEALLKETIRPSIKAATGYGVIDLRDVARAGVIDNLLREKIRDSAFILADLTHENAGAYWESGYAEGLGKPVIYLCEQQKFADAKTHFDTNHCTTVMWSSADLEGFGANLVATVRRSLNLFPSG